MNLDAVIGCRSFGFGSLEGGVWGAAWIAAGGGLWLALGTGDEATVASVTVDDGADDNAWRVRGEGLDLVLSPAGPAALEPEGDLAALDQLCRVDGTVELGGGSRAVSAPGWRASGALGLPGEQLESFRQLAAWFEPGEGLAVLSVRPRGARGQESDRVSAVVFEPEAAIRVEDPRLSTTYAEDGTPRRAGLELWIGDQEEQQHSRRAAGEALGVSSTWTADGLELEALPFRWHSSGRDGAGLYLLGRSA